MRKSWSCLDGVRVLDLFLLAFSFGLFLLADAAPPDPRIKEATAPSTYPTYWPLLMGQA
jgi:hypothetical protein